MRSSLGSALIVLAWFGPSLAHDIPNARVDRSIQATIYPSRLRVDYEVSLAELTLIQDLRRLGVEPPGDDRRGWYEEYGNVTGPLNAKGFLVAVGGQEVELRSVGFDLSVEGHPRYTFHFEADIPSNGRLVLNDTNYQASEGTSRLAVRPAEGIEVRGDDLPADVTTIEIRPVWQLSDSDERRTRRLLIEYAVSTRPPMVSTIEATAVSIRPVSDLSSGLSRFLDRAGDRAWPALIMAAFVFGAFHAIQPGHGKTIVAVATLGPSRGPLWGALLGLATATVHLGSVAFIAAALYASRSNRSAEFHAVLTRFAGFTIAIFGAWKVGGHLAGFHGHDHSKAYPDNLPPSGIFPLALAAGLVPCWDAVALLLVAEAIDRLLLGMALLCAFSLGMASVLVLVGLAAGRFRDSIELRDPNRTWERRLGVLGGSILTMIGVAMIAS